MKRLVIQFDEQTLAALNRIARLGKKQRAEFIRQAIWRAVRQAGYRAMRGAYRRQPDSMEDWEPWVDRTATVL